MSNSGVASLLIILGEPHYDNQIRPVLDRILEGLTVWDQSKSTVDLNTELLNFINKNVTPEKVEGGTILRSEGKVHIEILVHPTVALLTQWLQNFLYQPTPYKLIIHAGPVFQGTGSWILRDGTFSLHDFARFTHKNEIASVLKERSTDTSSTTTISCINEGEWNDNGFKLHELNKRYSISVQQKGAYDALQCTNNVLSYFNRYITYCDLTELMPSSNIVGSVRFRRPTIYMFPAGQGDAALFGVSGFTLLLDGGYQWKSCFWDFLRHVDRIDAMLVSRLNAGTINGARSFVKRLSLEPETHPKLGYAFMNAPSRQAASAAVSSPSGNPLLVSVSDQTFDVIESLAKLSLEPHPLSFTVSVVSKHLEPLTLYQKVGHGRLEMYVLNPAKDSKELNEFTTNFKRFSMLHLHSGGQQATANPFSVKPNQTQHGAYPVPFTAQLSIAALIVWHPANAQENVIRVLYPGSCPQDRLLASLDKLKHLEFLKHSACTPASLESGRGVKGTPARKPAENNAKLLSPTPKPPSTVNHERHPITGTNLVRTSPVPPPTHHVPADQRQHHEAHAPADHHREPHGRVVDHEHHKDALLVDTQQHHHQPQVSPQPKIDAIPKSPKVETFLEASAPLMAASAEHSVPDEILEKHGMSAFAPPSGGRKHADDFHDEQQHGHNAHHESRSHHRGADHHEEIHERGFIDRHEEAHERGFVNEVPHPHHHRNLMDEDLSGHKADHEISYPADDDLLVHHHVPKVAVCPAKPFDPHQHEKPLFESLETHSLRRTEDNTSDTASPLSPVASDDVHRRATKDSPVDPIQRPLLDFGGNADFVAHDTSPVDIFDHHHHPHQQHEHQHQQQQQQHSPLESPSSPGRPHSATRLNPDAPVFIPTHSIGSDDASADLLDSFGGGQQPKPSHSPSAGFSNGVHPDVPGGIVVDAHHEHHHHQQGAEKRSLDEMMKTFDGQMPGGEDIPDEELMKAWGKPLGAPPPPGVVVGPAAAAKSMTSSSTAKKPAAAASSKTSDAAAKAKPSAAAATSSAANKKPAAATAASSKQTNGTDNKPASAGAKKPAAAAAANKSSSQSPASKSPNATTGATAAASSKPATKAPPPAKSAGLAAAAAKMKPPSAASSPASTKPAASAATKPAPAATKSAPAATKPAAGKSAASAAASGKKQPPAVGGPSYYVDLTYVPHNGNPHFVNADFFKAVRAKYYVLSSLQAPKETLEAFLAGKKAWNMPEEEVTLIPTYDSDSLNLWMSVHRDDLTVESIDVAPSCARCSLNLEEHHGTVCAAYRLEL